MAGLLHLRKLPALGAPAAPVPETTLFLVRWACLAGCCRGCHVLLCKGRVGSQGRSAEKDPLTEIRYTLLCRHRRRRLSITPVEVDPDAEAAAAASGGGGRSAAGQLCGGPPSAAKAMDF